MFLHKLTLIMMFYCNNKNSSKDAIHHAHKHMGLDVTPSRSQPTGLPALISAKLHPPHTQRFHGPYISGLTPSWTWFSGIYRCLSASKLCKVFKTHHCQCSHHCSREHLLRESLITSVPQHLEQGLAYGIC